MVKSYVIQIKTSVNQRLGSFLDQLAFVHKNKTQVFLLGLINVFNTAENELDFKVNSHAYKKQGVFRLTRSFLSFHLKNKNLIAMV